MFRFQISIPEEVGDASLGERPFLEDKTLKKKEEDITKIIIETEKEEGGVEFVPLTHPTVLNVPTRVYVGELTKIGLSIIGGEMPIELRLLLELPNPDAVDAHNPVFLGILGHSKGDSGKGIVLLMRKKHISEVYILELVRVSDKEAPCKKGLCFLDEGDCSRGLVLLDIPYLDPEPRAVAEIIDDLVLVIAYAD